MGMRTPSSLPFPLCLGCSWRWPASVSAAAVGAAPGPAFVSAFALAGLCMFCTRRSSTNLQSWHKPLSEGPGRAALSDLSVLLPGSSPLSPRFSDQRFLFVSLSGHQFPGSHPWCAELSCGGGHSSGVILKALGRSTDLTHQSQGCQALSRSASCSWRNLAGTHNGALDPPESANTSSVPQRWRKHSQGKLLFFSFIRPCKS